jgi:hypothetical protein
MANYVSGNRPNHDERQGMSESKEVQIAELIRQLLEGDTQKQKNLRLPRAVEFATLEAMIREGQSLRDAWLVGQFDDTAFHDQCGQWFNWVASVQDEATQDLARHRAEDIRGLLTQLDDEWQACGAAWDAALALMTNPTYAADDELLLRRSLFNFYALPVQERQSRPAIQGLLNQQAQLRPL